MYNSIEGTLQVVRISNGKINLVKAIQKGSFFTGVAAGLAGEAGVMANAASLAMCDGEDVQHIACLINNQLAVGTFEYLEDIQVGDQVKLVVSDIEEGVLYIHAILRIEDQLLWLPYSIDHTRMGWVMHGIKMSGLLVLFVVILLLFAGVILEGEIWNEDSSYLVLGAVGMMAILMPLSTYGVMGLGEEAESIFCALGIPKYKFFRVKPFSLIKERGVYDEYNKGCIYRFDKAMSFHKKRFNLC